MYNITFQQIEIFLHIAKYMNLSKTAEAMKLSQPAVSKMLLRFEEGIGVRLYNRGYKSTELTKEGEHLFSLLEPLYDNLNGVIETARSIADIPAKSVRLFTPNAFDISDNFKESNRIVSLFEEQNPDVLLMHMMGNLNDLLHAIRFCNADIFIIQDDVANSIKGLSYKKISPFCFNVAVSEDNPKLKDPNFSIEMLSSETVYLEDVRDDCYRNAELVRGLCIENGFSPSNIEFVDDYLMLFNVLKRNKGICICGRLTGFGDSVAIRYFPLTRVDEQRWAVAAWHTNKLTPYAADLIDLIPGEIVNV